jgi:hypothetical protein
MLRNFHIYRAKLEKDLHPKLVVLFLYNESVKYALSLPEDIMTIQSAHSHDELFQYFGLLYLSKEPLPASDVLELISQYLFEKYKNGTCVSCMINGEDTLKPSIQTHLLPIPELSTPDSEITPVIEKKVEINPVVSVVSEIKQVEARLPEVPVIIKKQKWCCF